MTGDALDDGALIGTAGGQFLLQSCRFGRLAAVALAVNGLSGAGGVRHLGLYGAVRVVAGHRRRSVPRRRRNGTV